MCCAVWDVGLTVLPGVPIRACTVIGHVVGVAMACSIVETRVVGAVVEGDFAVDAYGWKKKIKRFGDLMLLEM